MGFPFINERRGWHPPVGIAFRFPVSQMCQFLHYSYDFLCLVLIFAVVILHYKKCLRRKKIRGKKSPKPKVRAAAPLYMGWTWPGAQAAGLEGPQHSCRHWYKTQASLAGEKCLRCYSWEFWKLVLSVIICQQILFLWCLVVKFWMGGEDWKNLEDHGVLMFTH